MRLFWMLGLFFLGITGAQGAQAFDLDAVGVHLASWHSNPQACGAMQCQNDNPGVYVRAGPWAVGGYRNSVGETTFYAGRRWQLLRRGRGGVEVAALLATGYPGAAVVPLIAPAATWRLTDHAVLRVSYLPRLGRWNPTHVLHLSLEFRRP